MIVEIACRVDKLRMTVAPAQCRTCRTQCPIIPFSFTSVDQKESSVAFWFFERDSDLCLVDFCARRRIVFLVPAFLCFFLLNRRQLSWGASPGCRPPEIPLREARQG